MSKRIHATAVAFGERAITLSGPSGCGKSDLALRLLDRGWRLVGDDQCHITRTEEGGLWIAGDARLRGRIEVRGLGLVAVDGVSDPLPWVLDVTLSADYPRLPAPRWSHHLGHRLPCITLNGFEMSAPIKLEWAIANPTLDGWSDL